MKVDNNNESINKMIDAAWQISYTSFWNTWTLSHFEVEGSKQFIKKFITRSEDRYNNYLEYCQRVLLAREFIIKNPQKYIPLPSKWFNKYNHNGFAGTYKWFMNLIATRRSLPLYRQQFKALPEAILEMHEEPTGKNFHYWRGWFIEREYQATANLFLCITGNSIYKY